MRSPRRFAAPLVVTVAALTGCAADTPPTANPPSQPEPQTPPHTVNPPAQVQPPPPPQQVALPVATDPAHVIKDPDGSCRQFTHVECPKGVNCNPPPPHAVQCPPGK